MSLLTILGETQDVYKRQIVNHSFSTVISQLSFIIYQLSTNMKDLITGAEALMRSLEHQGVTTIFGYPGGSIMPVFDALYLSLIHIL